ncbi:MAG: hypothetical protein LQ341_007299 [Variospora aurantia]|nr:MAG: hypothetical protein LQ341_007299 [Variospora aurantia]
MRSCRSVSSGRKDALVEAAWVAVGITLLPFIAVCWGCEELVKRTRRNHRLRKHIREYDWAAKRREKEILENAPQPLPAHRARRLSILPTSKSQTQSAFLTRLPLEVRQDIYTYVLGSNLTHIVCKQGRLAHVRCKHTQEMDHQRLCRTAAIGTCHDETSMLASTSNGNIALLGSCSQIYNEATDLLYSSNTFDFDHQDLFLFFARSILPSRLASIRCLHLNLKVSSIKQPFIWADNAPNGWSLMWEIIGRDMPGLKHLRVRLVGWTGAPFPTMEDWWMESMLQVKNLKTFRIIFDSPSNNWSEYGEGVIVMSTLLDDHIRSMVCSEAY